jgi:Rrf2 family protein
MSKPFNISEAASIAIHAMALIAGSPENLNAVQLSLMTGFSKNHIAKIMGLLTRSQFLVSERGPKGGFVLKRNAETLSLLEIYEAIEGVIDEQPCGEQCDLCIARGCVFGGLSVKFTKDFKHYLTMKKLSDFIN